MLSAGALTILRLCDSAWWLCEKMTCFWKFSLVWVHQNSSQRILPNAPALKGRHWGSAFPPGPGPEQSLDLEVTVRLSQRLTRAVAMVGPPGCKFLEGRSIWFPDLSLCSYCLGYCLVTIWMDWEGDASMLFPMAAVGTYNKEQDWSLCPTGCNMKFLRSDAFKRPPKPSRVTLMMTRCRTEIKLTHRDLSPMRG